MVIKSGKDFIKIINKPILTRELIVEFIKTIALYFTIDKPIDELTNIISLSVDELEEYKDFYNKELDEKYTFDEFISLATLTYSNFSVYSQDSEVLIGNVDFCPDGDVDCIWIDVIDKKNIEGLLQAINDCSNQLIQ